MIDKFRLKTKVYQVTSDKLTLELKGNHAVLANQELKDHINEIVYVKMESYSEYKTNAQNRLFHALITKYWNSNLFSYSSFLRKEPDNWAELKIDVKARMNPSCVKQIHKFKDIAEMGSVKADPIIIGDNYYLIKSWASFTVADATHTIDRLMDEMIEQGIKVDSEIIEHREIKQRPAHQKELDFIGG